MVDRESLELSISACKAEVLAIYTNDPCAEYVGFEPLPQSDSLVILAAIRRTPFCVPTRSRTLTKGLEDPCAFHYTIRTLAGTEGLEPSTFGLTGRSYFHTSYIPLGSG